MIRLILYFYALTVALLGSFLMAYALYQLWAVESFLSSITQLRGSEVLVQRWEEFQAQYLPVQVLSRTDIAAKVEALIPLLNNTNIDPDSQIANISAQLGLASWGKSAQTLLANLWAEYQRVQRETYWQIVLFLVANCLAFGALFLYLLIGRAVEKIWIPLLLLHFSLYLILLYFYSLPSLVLYIIQGNGYYFWGYSIFPLLLFVYFIYLLKNAQQRKTI
ncbi:MAG: hypothetical protein EAZ55_07025 [Cytophagales bacterium]|nr:MAG: hypothetical protein EAZ55_07025 [Cytophagales bacterium]